MNKQVVALATDEENIVMWDMDALLLDYQDQPYIPVDTNLLIPEDWLRLDREYALTTDVTKPLILFEIPEGKLFIADGNHRLYRATVEQIEKMNVVIIPQEKHVSYLFRCSTDDYRKVLKTLDPVSIVIGVSSAKHRYYYRRQYGNDTAADGRKGTSDGSHRFSFLTLIGNGRNDGPDRNVIGIIGRRP